MTLNDTIEKYKELTGICARTDYADKKSVKKHNYSVDKMYEIVSSLMEKFGENGLMEFEKLLTLEENRTNVWVSFQLLERLSPSKVAEKEALKIITKLSEGNGSEALGCQYWLKNWENKTTGNSGFAQ